MLEDQLAVSQDCVNKVTTQDFIDNNNDDGNDRNYNNDFQNNYEENCYSENDDLSCPSLLEGSSVQNDATTATNRQKQRHRQHDRMDRLLEHADAVLSSMKEDNARYIRENPEISAFMDEIMRAILFKKPADPLDLAYRVLRERRRKEKMMVLSSSKQLMGEPTRSQNRGALAQRNENNSDYTCCTNETLSTDKSSSATVSVAESPSLLSGYSYCFVF